MSDENVYGIYRELAKERMRQIEREGFDSTHDDQHTDRSLALAAALYASPIPLQEVTVHEDGSVSTRDPWPWWDVDNDPQSRGAPSKAWDKRRKHKERRRLIISAALLIAEIQRIDRMKER